MSGDLRYLSLCSGAGGLDVGLEMVGWRPLAQIEIDRDCCRTLAAQNVLMGRDVPVLNAGIETIDPRELRLSLGLARGELDLIAGGPPCQPFTTHGLRQTLSDPRASAVFPSFLNHVREFEPKAVIVENVDGFLSAALEHVPLTERASRPLHRREMKGSFLEWVLLELDRLGYSVSWGVAEAADYGVPQYRQRAILIATQRDQPCFLPPATAPRARTVREGLSSVTDPGPIQPLSARKRAIYALIPPGGNWRNLPPDVQEATMGRAFFATGGKSGWWRRLAWDQPSPTILGMPDHSSTGLIHPDEVRCLGLNECAALQSFPALHPFQGSSRSQYQQVGNAVPPLLGRAIGEALIAHLEARPSSRPPSPDWRSESANRRIGTHGWLLRSGNRGQVTMNAKVRPDHVWALQDGEFTVDPTGGPAPARGGAEDGLRRSA